ncbi:hypothetical protein B0T16DRAFT_393764 [Cercophora newfieldiana]|uniref:Uncharacterized protein n=1 Tax=Cercophora newfieldiana TaxID=92897 RepID=A0AA40CL57_9PEZI|nr:hypothetical protein B0T16DRAFT_393764 [Cercophora newfieldiana]
MLEDDFLDFVNLKRAYLLSICSRHTIGEANLLEKYDGDTQMTRKAWSQKELAELLKEERLAIEQRSKGWGVFSPVTYASTGSELIHIQHNQNVYNLINSMPVPVAVET